SAELSVINDDAARMQALLAGEVDVTHRVVVPLVDQINAAGNFELVQAAAGYHFIMPMMCDTPPYNNPDVRMALKYCMNREKLVEMLFGKFARRGNDHPIPESDPYHNNELPQTEYDPEKAAFHAKKAGLGTKDVILSASDAAFNGAVDMSILFQATAAAAGINVTVKREPADGFWDNVWLKAPFMTSYWGGRPAATQMLAVAYSAAAPWNDTHWKVDAFEKLLADAKATTDQAKRKDYIWEMQSMLHEQGGALIPLFKDWLDVHDKKVKGHTPHGMFDLCNSRIVQKAWIEA
ncbi:MAG TPA: ABC transporter substrate-binding protein, partial [Dongiaceae bacterium]|nr:ABC transporter substrate-binding protein [Dongiaceae bacterium]